MRSALTWLLALGLAGTLVELLLLDHDEELTQFIPLVLLSAALVGLSWMRLRPSAAAVRVFGVLMLLLIVSGGVGVVLHFRANMEFQREVAPSLGWIALARKAVRAKAPPALAPGVLVQLGCLGVILAASEAGLAFQSRRSGALDKGE